MGRSCFFVAPLPSHEPWGQGPSLWWGNFMFSYTVETKVKNNDESKEESMEKEEVDKSKKSLVG